MTYEIIACKDPIYVDHPIPKVSENYEFFPTYKVVEYMEDHGFEMNRVIKLGKRSPHPEYGQHLVTFRKQGQKEIEGGYPELIFWNSHNKTRAARFLEGFFRSICENGCIFGSFQQDTGRITHYRNPFDQLMEIVKVGVDSVDRKISRIIDMKQRVLSLEEIYDFSVKAKALRPSVENENQLVWSNRVEDDAEDLWTIYNRAQENLMRGNFEGRTPTGKSRKARPLKNIQKTVELNTQLWEVANEYLPA